MGSNEEYIYHMFKNVNSDETASIKLREDTVAWMSY